MREEKIFQKRRSRINELRAKNEKLTSCQRAFKAINFEEADRITIDNWMAPEVKKRCLGYWGCDNEEELLEFLGVDIRNNYGPKYIGPKLGPTTDIWGIKRKLITYAKDTPQEGKYLELAESPLKNLTLKEIKEYQNWPSPDWWNYSKIKKECAYWHPNYFVINKNDRLNRTSQLKQIMYLRGIEQTLLDLVINPKIIECIRDRVVNYYLEFNSRVFSAAHSEIDMFMMGDDMGMQKGPLISPDMWKRYFAKGFRRFCDLAHKYGLKVMYHTCGDVHLLIPLFIENGLDMLQSLQPVSPNMDIKKLKKKFGKNLLLQGGVDIQQILPRGKPQNVKKAVRYIAESIKPDGGYFFGTSHNIQNDTPMENIVALFEAYHEYGVY